jgi:Alginate lyase
MFAITLFFQFFLLLLPQVSGYNHSFVHPGLMVTDANIEFAKKQISGGLNPWLNSWNKLISIKYSHTEYTSQAVETIYRSNWGNNTANAQLLWQDVAAAFNLALRWKISGDTQYADCAAKILVSWGETLQTLGGGDDISLTAGLQGYELANAAELLRDYQPFTENGLAIITDMLLRVILPLNEKFLNHGESSEHNVKHFFANWELCNVASAMAIGVLADNQTAWDFGVNYFKNGSGNGCIGNAITNIVQEPDTGKQLGQGQEEGRDQGHSALDFQLLGVIGQQAWNQGVDLFGYDGNRILLGYVSVQRPLPSRQVWAD